jgi:hypothetical protein
MASTEVAPQCGHVIVERRCKAGVQMRPAGTFAAWRLFNKAIKITVSRL